MGYVISKGIDETLSHIKQTLIQQTNFLKFIYFRGYPLAALVIMTNTTKQKNNMEPVIYMEETAFRKTTNPSRMKKYSHGGICNSI